MCSEFDPYHRWLGIPPEEQPPNHYRLLGIPLFESEFETIEHAADQRMVYLRTLQTGRQAKLCERLLNEVAAARLCLLNPARKAGYDGQLRSRLKAAATVRLSDTQRTVDPAPPSAAAEAPKKTDATAFGEYDLLEQLSTGGTGAVYKARHRTMGRVVALKILSAEATRYPEMVARFLRKVKILAQLTHPNLVAAYDAGERDGKHYLITEYIDGQDLGTIVRQCGPLSIEHVLSYVTQAARGLGFAHAHSIYHRNVKPANLLVDRQGVLKVIGLGLARIDFEALPDDVNLGPQITLDGAVMGTVDYMAPEQAADSSRVDHRADIYALGCTMCTLLTGQPPYPGKSPLLKAMAHRKQPIPMLRAVRADVPLPLDALFQRMLAKRPEDRPQSMNEVMAALRGC